MKTRIGLTVSLVWVLAFSVSLLISPFSINAQSDIGPLLSEDILISGGIEWAGRANVAFDGTRYLVVWTQFTDIVTRFDVYGRFVDTAGEALAPPFRIGWTAIDDVMPDVAFNGDYFLVVWVNGLELRCQVVGTDGQLIGDPLVRNSTSFYKREPAVSTDGNEFLVVWRNHDFMMGANDILAQFVDVDSVGNPSFRGVPFVMTPAVGDQFVPSIAYGIDSYLVTWTNDLGAGYDLYGALVGLDASVEPRYDLVSGGGTIFPAGIAFDGTNYLIVCNSGGLLYGLRVSVTGVPIKGPFLISFNPSYGNVAFGDGEYLVVWDSNEIMGTRVSLNGEVLDSPAVDLSVMTGADQLYPALAFGDGNYLVTWQDGAHAKYAQLVGLTYQTPEEMLVDLFEDVLALSEEYNIPEGSLNLLETASSALEDANTKNDVSAINKLNAFINQVIAHRNNGDIPHEEANALIAAAQAIIDELESG